MSKTIVVKGDKVTGTDVHNVVTNNGPGPAGYDWSGPVRAEKAPFFTIGGKAVATVGDQADLDPPHIPASPHPPPAPPGAPTAWSGPAPSGDAKPAAGAGSTFFKAGGEFVLLDGGKFSGCANAVAASSNLSVAATESFFTVNE